MSAPDQTSRNTRRTSRRAIEIIAVSIVLLLAAYLRLNHLDWTEFKLDEAHLSQIAFDMARHGEIPLTGIGSSVGIMNPPLAAWLLAIPYALSSSPIVATGFIALLNVAAVALCYGLSRKMFMPLGDYAWLGALIAAALFAVAPWAVIHSRKVWAQDLLPFFVLLYAWFGYRAFVQCKPWSLAGHGLALAAMIQIHYSALWLAPVSLVWLIAFARRIRLAPLIVTALIGVAAFAPFLIADGLRGWPSVTRLLDLARQPATTDAAAIHLAWITATGAEIHSLAGPQEFENYRALVPFGDTVSGLVGLLVLGGSIVAAVDALSAFPRRRWNDRAAASFMLVTWLVLPVLGQVSHRMPLFVHYFLIVLPAPFMLIGYLAVRVAGVPTSAPASGQPAAVPTQAGTGDEGKVRRWIGLFTFVSIALIVVAQAVQTITLQQFVASRPTPGAMGVPIGYYEYIVNEAKNALTQTGGAEIIVNTRGLNPDSDEYPAIFDFLLNEVPHRFVDLSQAVGVYPAAAHIQIDYAPYDSTLPVKAGRNLVEEIPLRAGEQPGRVYRSGGYTDPPCEVKDSPARWQNGVSLLSAQIDPLKPGEQAAIRLCLKINQLATEEYHWTAQLWDRAGRRWAQVDDNGYPARDWRTGDVITQDLLLAMPVDLPAGDYVLRVGQYTWPDVKAVLTLDVAGNPQSDAVEIPVRVTR